MLDDLAGHPTRFGFGIECLVITDAAPARIRSPEVLSFALKIVLHHRTRYVEDCLRRAIVLFQPDGLGVWKMLFEVQNVGYISAAPFVN